MENDPTSAFKTVIGNQAVTVTARNEKEKVDILFAEYVSDLVHVIERVMSEEKITRAEMAKRLKKNASTISRQLDGEANLSAKTICEFFAVLGDRPLASSGKYERLVAKGNAQDVICTAKDGHLYSPVSPTVSVWIERLQKSGYKKAQTHFWYRSHNANPVSDECLAGLD